MAAGATGSGDGRQRVVLGGVGARVARRAAGAPARTVVVVTALAAAAALAAVGRVVVLVLLGPRSGLDFRPLYEAGVAARQGWPLYSVPDFVYPPLAAFAAEPLSAASPRTAFAAWTALTTTALVLTCAGLAVLLVPPEQRRWRVAAGAGLVLALFAARATTRSVGLGNASLLLPPVALGTCCLWARGRWHAGTALLVGSLVVKPVLLPLALVPALRRRWSVLLVWTTAGGVVTAAAVAASTGLAGAPRAVAGLLRASHFTGRDRPLNLSLAGLAAVHPALDPVLDAARVAAVLVAVVAAVRWAVRPRPGAAAPDTAPDDAPHTALTRRRGASTEAVGLLTASTVLLVALLLAGSISEVHYLLVLVPGLVAVLVARAGAPRWLAGLAALALLGAQLRGARVSTQALLVSVEVLVLAACALSLAARPRAARGAAPAQSARRS